MIDVLVICIPLYLHPIDILRAKTVFLEKDCKKRISISYLLERNFLPFRKKLKFQTFSCLKFCFKIPKF